MAISQIERLGCRWESSDVSLPTLSIDIPPEVEQREVLDILEALRKANAIYLDVGFLPDIVR